MDRRRWSRVGLVFLAPVAVAACATSTPRDELLRRASFDLRCTKDELHVTKISDDTRGVRGCGKQATYIRHCKPPGFECTWILNGLDRGDDDDDR
jgi:hypothetical protein